MVCYLALIILMIAGFWKTFEKAGQPGWAAIIPIYNIYVMLKIVGRPGWWLILFFIPFANVIVYFILAIDVAKSFGKDALYGIILLGFLSYIGYLILGFGDAVYQGPSAA
ncbi:MAG TPA: signal peptidase I [Anaerolineae bacterium]|nr:signal peptidase I [Anaerolineae bacterium]